MMQAGSTEASLKRRKFSINTGPACFLCFGDILCGNAPSNGDDENIQNISYHSANTIFSSTCHSSIKPEGEPECCTPGEISLGAVCRYLTINFRQVLRGHGSNHENIKELMDEKILDVSVRTCKECFHIIEPLSNLCMELELLQMKLENRTKSLWEALENSESRQSSFDQFGNKQPYENHQQEIAKLLRHEMKRKCQVKLDQAVPKVKLVKIPSILLTVKEPKLTPCVKVEILEIESAPIPSLGNEIHEADPLGDTVQRNLSECSPVSRSGPKSRYEVCKLCDPPRRVPAPDKERHKIRNHLETLFIYYKLPHVTMMEFKEYCKYVLDMEVLSCGKLHSAEGNQTGKCAHCNYTSTSMYHLRFLRNHVCTVHRNVVAAKISELQKSTTFVDLQEMQLSLSILYKEQRRDANRRVSQCDVCGQVFQHQTSLARHRKVEHDGIIPKKKICKCKVCGGIFENLQALLKHRKLEHLQPSKHAIGSSNSRKRHVEEPCAEGRIEESIAVSGYSMGHNEGSSSNGMGENPAEQEYFSVSNINGEPGDDDCHDDVQVEMKIVLN